MPKNCANPQCKKPFEVTDEDRRFLKSLAPKIGDRTFDLPEPDRCPDCRQRLRQGFINQLHLYKNTCALTKKSIISNFAPDSGFVVYDQAAWWGDGWDPLSYGRDFDFNRPFFEQFNELSHAVPYPNLVTAYQYDENSEYTNYAGKNKNCYLIFDSDESRDCYYSYSINGCIDCCDCYRVRRSELVTDSIDCVQCYGSSYLQDCSNCTDSMFLKNCIGCKHCIMCMNLRNKEYFVENKPVSKEDFERIQDSLTSREAIRSSASHFDAIALQYPQKSMRGFQNEDCVGDYLINCKNAYVCFDSENLWDCRYIFQGFMPIKDSMDLEQCGDLERGYECSNCGYSAHSMLFSAGTLECRDCLYEAFCFHSTNLFGCVSVKRKKYCIFNKQYKKEEYEVLVPKIIEHMKKTPYQSPDGSGTGQAGEWGQFFPPALALYPYNETTAIEYYPLTEQEARAAGYAWRAKDKTEYQKPTFSPPPTIAGVQDAVVNERLACSSCGRNYKITAQELALLRRKNLPLPTECFLCRHRARKAKRNPRVLYDRTCAKCGKAIRTTFAPERPEVVYCEECYQQSVS